MTTVDDAMNNPPDGIDHISVSRYRRKDGTWFWGVSISVGNMVYSNPFDGDSSSFAPCYQSLIARWREPIPDDVLITAYDEAAKRFNSMNGAML